MIQATVTVRNDRILKIEVSGHADSADYGKDIVCAEVSAVTTGLCNAIDEAGFNADMRVEAGHVVIAAQNDDSHDLQVMLKTGVAQLKTIEYTNSEYIKVTNTEV